ncbi:MAG: endonuclease [Myxococcales bacterium]|nr:endonuclease [Myxococcales bacterium]
MDPKEFETELRKTLSDGALSRSERRGLRELSGDADAATLAHYRNMAFAIAREELGPSADTERVLCWLEASIKALLPESEAPRATATALFSPGDGPLSKLIGLLGAARSTVDICVFTITDDRIAGAIHACHERGVAVRIITDDDKSLDLGSDVERLRRSGIPIRTDRSEHHMHHKFALFDRAMLVTGSYNWTRAATSSNHENIIVTDEPRLAKPFATLFERLWDELGR